MDLFTSTFNYLEVFIFMQLQLARHLDKGKVLDISGIADEFVLQKSKILFDNLPQVRRRLDGSYIRRQNSTGVLSFLAPVLEESKDFLQKFKVKESEEAVGDVSKTMVPSQPQPHSVIKQEDSIGEHEEMTMEDKTKYSNIEAKESAPRTSGPAMPTASQLAEAAEIMANLDNVNQDEELIGPAPPEMLTEDLEASEGQRLSEVGRILGVLRDHEGKHVVNSKSQTVEPNPYDILGLAKDASTVDIKKKYWKLSLLIHPDKCSHPSAATAFKAVSMAATKLQDTEGRIAADNAIDIQEEAAARKAIEKELERERAWRIAKNEATAEDLKGPISRVQERESWMTSLPEKVQKSASVPSSSQKSFTKSKVYVQDASWAETPGKDIARLQGPSMRQEPQQISGASATHTQSQLPSRGKSLLEKHLETQIKSTERSKKSQDSSKFEYKPFDREKDLELRKSSKKQSDPRDKLKGIPGLGSRFGAGSSHV